MAVRNYTCIVLTCYHITFDFVNGFTEGRNPPPSAGSTTHMGMIFSVMDKW